jgi:hypothetical protein
MTSHHCHPATAWVTCRFQGHHDVISGIGYLPAPMDCYITSSWDQEIRLWKRPVPNASSAGSNGSGGAGASSSSKASAGAAAAGGSRKGGSGAEGAYLLPKDSEDGNNFVSEYENAHPLVVPKALSQVSLSCGCLS